jgi:uncharacterized protein
MISASAAQSTCSRCGAQFQCGMQAGLGKCWCSSLQPVTPIESAAGCFCPDCLAALVNAQREGKASGHL